MTESTKRGFNAKISDCGEVNGGQSLVSCANAAEGPPGSAAEILLLLLIIYESAAILVWRN